MSNAGRTVRGSDGRTRSIIWGRTGWGALVLWQHSDQGSVCYTTACCVASAPQSLKPVSKHALVVSVPVALKSLGGIVTPLGAEKLRELRVARLHLLARREPMVGQVVAPAVADPRVDELAEFRGRALQPRGAVDHVQVEDHARVRLFGPGKKALVVPLDETDGAVDQGGALRAEPLAHVREKAGQRIPRRVDLGDQLRGRLGGAEPAVQGAMVIVQVRTELVRVRPVHLSRGREVVAGVGLERPRPVGVREIDELVPVVRGQLLLFRSYRRAGRDGAIAREDPLPQKIGGVGVGVVLEV